MSKTLVISFVYYLLYISTYSQTTFYKDIYKGGVSGGGFTAYGTGTIFYEIPDNSSIKKAFLLCANWLTDTVQHSIYIDGYEVILDSNRRVTQEYLSNTNIGNNYSSVYVSDITNIININNDSLVINSPVNINNSFQYYLDFYVIIFYENISFPLISASIDVLDKNVVGIMNNSHNIESPFLAKPLSVSLLTGHMTTFDDSTDVYLNDSIFIGRIGGQEEDCLSSAGVFGNFYYQNDTLYGLKDDTPDSIMNGSDVLFDLKSYNIESNFSLKYIYQDYVSPTPESTTNPIWATFLTYSTKCDTLHSYSNISDTTICFGEPLELIVGGDSTYLYSWRYKGNIVSTDSILNIAPEQSRIYSILVSDTSGCSKTEIINIKVKENPNHYNSTQDAVCPNNNGVIVIDSVQGIAPPYRYNIDNGTWQTAPVFANLSSGSYDVGVIDTNGCISTNVINIQDSIDTQADFVFPIYSTNSPTTINFENQSENATNYQWYINGLLVTTETNLSYLFEEEGEYEIFLIASKTNGLCSDTLVKNFSLENDNTLILSNIWKVDNKLLLISNGYDKLRFRLLNTLGQVVLYKEKSLINGQNTIIQERNLARGIYIYQMEVVDKNGKTESFEGKLLRF
ncbi:MAG: hypothetical protein N4A35_17060 [Flavobacteriales bacterium]|jgi:hypothetical protein|nr:hypothetical protein [Flavobacteriales bacterium]